MVHLSLGNHPIYQLYFWKPLCILLADLSVGVLAQAAVWHASLQPPAEDRWNVVSTGANTGSAHCGERVCESCFLADHVTDLPLEVS